MRSLRAVSTWERIVAAVDMAKYIRLMFAYPVHGLSTAHCTNVRAFERNCMKLWTIKASKNSNRSMTGNLHFYWGEQEANMAQ
jgi:hypothetical protein